MSATIPKVTVSLAVYNTEKYIGEAVDSILNQTFDNFEFIIVNDGSTDRTKEILEGYQDRRIKLINNKENLGVSTSRNISIRHAKGQYIAIMDGDDIALPERFAKQVCFLDQHPEITVVGSACYYIDGNSCIRRLKQVVTDDAQIKRWMSLNTIRAYLWHPTTVIRKEALMDVGLYNERLSRAEDKDLWIRLAAKGYKFANMSELLLKKRVLGKPALSQQNKEVYAVYVQNLISIRKKYKDLDIPSLPQHKLNRLEKKAYADLYVRLGRDLFSFSQPFLATKSFLAAIKCFFN